MVWWMSSRRFVPSLPCHWLHWPRLPLPMELRPLILFWFDFGKESGMIVHVHYPHLLPSPPPTSSHLPLPSPPPTSSHLLLPSSLPPPTSLPPSLPSSRAHRGKGLAAFLKAIGYLIPLMDNESANYYTREVMVILIREFQSPDEEMKKIVLKVVLT